MKFCSTLGACLIRGLLPAVLALSPLGGEPVLQFSTFFGGEFGEAAYGVAIGGDGSIYVLGQSRDMQPAAGGFGSPDEPSFDLFITKLTPDGSQVIYTAVIGGSARDRGNAIAVDEDGAAYITGFTFSSDFPVTDQAPQPVFAGGSRDAFVLKLSPDGSQLLYSTYLGGSSFEDGQSLALDASGAVYVAGGTGSPDFPATSGAFQPEAAGALSNAFIAKLAPAGNLEWSTYLGGAARDEARAISRRPTGGVVVAGYTQSADFPVTPNVLQVGKAQIDDGFLAELSADGARLLRSTFLGGSSEDRIQALSLDPMGRPIVTGRSRSPDLPVSANAPQPLYAGGNFFGDAFVARLSDDFSQVEFLTYLGGFSEDEGNAVAIDAQGNVLVAGSTGSRDFPATAGSLQPEWGGLDDVFLAQLSSGGSVLRSSTFLGGGQGDRGFALAARGFSAVLGGNSSSSGFPVTANALQPRLGSPREGGDAVIVRVDFLPQPEFSSGAVRNAASSLGGPIAPGALLSIFGDDLGPADPLGARFGGDGRLTAELGGVRVLFDGAPAPLLFVSATQINVAAPFFPEGASTTTIEVDYAGHLSGPVAAPIAAVAPGLFTLDGRGAGPAAVLNQDGSINSPEYPAAPGAIIVMFGTGAGQTDPPGIAGRPAAPPLAKPEEAVVVRVAGIEAEVLYAGAAPGLVEGVIQVNARIPEAVGAGAAVPLQLQVAIWASQPGVTIAVE